ncbi:MAG: DUF4325 domain-containing protein [Oscillospiraceae bacterium]|nr:DUF4325 domain-containing protein [Oscillospiraceae bacterium]
MKEIKLNFPKDINRLAGFPYGKKIYVEQVEHLISDKELITIVFPEHIEKAASSFVQGFFSTLVSTIGYEGIEKNIVIKSGTDELSNSIRRNIY